jgi:ribonuclease HI
MVFSFFGGIMKKKKYYAIHKGQPPAPVIIDDWILCKEKIHNFPGAQYKSFKTKEAAIAYLAMKEGVEPLVFVADHPELAEGIQMALLENKEDLIYNRPKETEVDLYVDGSFQEGIAAYGYGCVLVLDGEVIDSFFGFGNKKDAVALRNVSGEMLGAVEGLKKVYSLGYKSVSLHFDYQGIESWAIGEWKRNNIHTAAYHEYMKKVRGKIQIAFVKVQAHSGNKWNEMADVLAKEGVQAAKHGKH